MPHNTSTQNVLDLNKGGYSKRAYGPTEDLIEIVETQLIGLDIDFDSMVGVGLSGHLVLPIVARYFDVPFFAVRKPEDRNHELNGNTGRGSIGKRWILVDDVVTTGATVKLARQAVSDAVSKFNFRTTFVGTVCYEPLWNASGEFVTPEMIRKSVKRIEFEGEYIYVDGTHYQTVYDNLEHYLTVNVFTAAQRTMAYFQTAYPEWDRDTLAIIVAEAERVLRTHY
jgi:hypothetical protein